MESRDPEEEGRIPVEASHDREAATLTVWFGPKEGEAVCSECTDGFVLMKAGAGGPIGAEILGFGSREEPAR